MSAQPLPVLKDQRGELEDMGMYIERSPKDIKIILFVTNPRKGKKQSGGAEIEMSRAVPARAALLDFPIQSLSP